jgi:peptidoglycan hydrolase CwlO-like protein
MAVETISAITALIIAVSVILTAVFNARKGTEDILREQIKTLDERLKSERATYDEKIKKLEESNKEKEKRIDELEKRIDVLSSELQKITHPKMRVGRMRKKL